jgi:hypothetical protein
MVMFIAAGAHTRCASTACIDKQTLHTIIHACIVPALYNATLTIKHHNTLFHFHRKNAARTAAYVVQCCSPELCTIRTLTHNQMQRSRSHAANITNGVAFVFNYRSAPPPAPSLPTLPMGNAGNVIYIYLIPTPNHLIPVILQVCGLQARTTLGLTLLLGPATPIHTCSRVATRHNLQ